MQRRWHLAVLLVIGALASSGCRGRLADLRECASLSVGVGQGLDATARIGPLAHPGLGAVGSRTWRLGLPGRAHGACWREEQLVWPMLPLFAERLQQTWGARGPGGTLAYARTADRGTPDATHVETVWFPLLSRPRRARATRFREVSAIEVGGTVLVVSARAGINPLELVDFLAGLVGLDPSRDDVHEPADEETRHE